MKHLSNITYKPWGRFDDLAESKGKWHLKLLVIKKGQQLSLQQHTRRNELWIIAEGKVQVRKSNKIYILAPQKSIMIGTKEMHRAKALTDAVIIEISFGSHKERDIIRLEDDYGRVKQVARKREP